VPIHDWNFATVLEYAVVHLKVQDVVVLRAFQLWCDTGPRQGEHRLLHPPLAEQCRDAKTRVDSRIKSPQTVLEKEERYKMIEQENVRLQIEHLYTYPLLKKAVDEQKVAVHGLYYDLATGETEKDRVIFQSSFSISFFIRFQGDPPDPGDPAVYEHHWYRGIFLFNDRPDMIRYITVMSVSFRFTLVTVHGF